MRDSIQQLDTISWCFEFCSRKILWNRWSHFVWIQSENGRESQIIRHINCFLVSLLLFYLLVQSLFTSPFLINSIWRPTRLEITFLHIWIWILRSFNVTYCFQVLQAVKTFGRSNSNRSDLLCTSEVAISFHKAKDQPCTQMVWCSDGLLARNEEYFLKCEMHRDIDRWTCTITILAIHDDQLHLICSSSCSFAFYWIKFSVFV